MKCPPASFSPDLLLKVLANEGSVTVNVATIERERR